MVGTAHLCSTLSAQNTLFIPLHLFYWFYGDFLVVYDAIKLSFDLFIVVIKQSFSLQVVQWKCHV